MLRRSLKIVLASSIALGATATATIPFGAKVFLEDKKENGQIQKPGDGNNPGNGGDNGNGPTDPGNGGDNGNGPTDPGNGGDNGNGPTDPGNGGDNGNEPADKRVEITRQPTSVEVFPGETATISVEYKAFNLSPNDKINFQWYKDGESLPNQTSQTLVLNNVKYSDVGDYYVSINIGFNLFVKSDTVTLNVKNESSQYDSIVFSDGTPAAYFFNWVENPLLKIDAFVQFSKDGSLYFNGEKVKVDFYIGNLLVRTLYTGPGNNVLYAMIECNRSDFEGKEIKIVASYDKLVREHKIDKVNYV